MTAVIRKLPSELPPQIAGHRNVPDDRVALHVSELSEEELEAIAQAEMSEECDFLNEELGPTHAVPR